MGCLLDCFRDCCKPSYLWFADKGCSLAECNPVTCYLAPCAKKYLNFESQKELVLKIFQRSPPQRTTTTWNSWDRISPSERMDSYAGIQVLESVIPTCTEDQQAELLGTVELTWREGWYEDGYVVSKLQALAKKGNEVAKRYNKAREDSFSHGSRRPETQRAANDFSARFQREYQEQKLREREQKFETEREAKKKEDDLIASDPKLALQVKMHREQIAATEEQTRAINSAAAAARGY